MQNQQAGIDSTGNIDRHITHMINRFIHCGGSIWGNTYPFEILFKGITWEMCSTIETHVFQKMS